MNGVALIYDLIFTQTCFYEEICGYALVRTFRKQLYEQLRPIHFCSNFSLVLSKVILKVYTEGEPENSVFSV